MAYPYTISDLLTGIGSTAGTPTTYYGGVWNKLSQRNDVITYGPQAIADAALELSQSFPFQGLQRTTSAPVQMTNGVYSYPFSTWVNAGDIPTFGTTANPKLIPSFFMFYDNPLNSYAGYNPGIGLMYKTIDSLELMFSTPGTPAYWTRYANLVFIAPQPNNSYYSYMRYQVQHPFNNPPVLTDTILLDDDWREIIEYSAALRLATNLRMLDYATQYHNILFGDPKKKGDTGLITARVSMLENDTVSSMGMKQIRPQNRRW
jgi:hypothetical protein